MVLSMDFKLVRISNVEKGIQVQDNIVIIEPNGYSFKKSIPSKFNMFKRNVPNPLIGSIIKFFQSKAETLGIIKNGEIYNNLIKFDKKMSEFSKEANKNPKNTVINSKDNTIKNVFKIAS